MSVNYHYHGPVVAFDLDDTLFRERDFCRSGFRYLEKHISELTSGSASGLFERMNKALEKRANYFDELECYIKEHDIVLPDGIGIPELVNLYRNHRPEILPVSDSFISTFRTLTKRGVKIAIITDGRSVTQRNKVATLGLEEFLDPEDIIISEETGFDKKHREPFAMLVNRYPEASSFSYIGDNPEKDFYYPNLLGWRTFQIKPHPDNVHLYKMPDDIIYRALIDIEQIEDIIKYI